MLCVALSIVTGLSYPLSMTGSGKLLFPAQVAGGLLTRGGKGAGWALISQPFQESRHLWSRLSTTSLMPNDGIDSIGYNFGPTNPALLEAARTRIAASRASVPTNSAPVPLNLVAASDADLDPDISPAAPSYQVGRVATARQLSADALPNRVIDAVEHPQSGVYGELRIDVLRLNLALDGLQ